MINTQKQDLYAKGESYSKMLEKGALLETNRMNRMSKKLTRSSVMINNMSK
jgi:hypothetical protein